MTIFGTTLHRVHDCNDCGHWAAQPSESEREGARGGHFCNSCWLAVPPDATVCPHCNSTFIPAAPPSPPSTGQSREQELLAVLRDCVEALENADQHFQEIRMDWSDPREEIRAGRAWIEPALAAARRALESKP